MYHVSTTPFGQRPVTACLIDTQQAETSENPAVEVDKYVLLDDLRAARAHYGLSDRALSVLATLLSFKSGRTISSQDNLTVFPSNRTLSERAHGMAESTLRRHLAALVKSGLVQRNDSPNGKRYAARDVYGNIVRSFGFDLRPLLNHANTIAERALTNRNAALTMRRHREDIILMARDASKLIAYAQLSNDRPALADLNAQIETLRSTFRRKLSSSELLNLRQQIHAILTAVTNHIEIAQTTKMSATDNQIERHHQNSNTELLDSKNPTTEPNPTHHANDQNQRPNLPLSLILKACPDIEPYSVSGKISHWHQLLATAHQVRRMMGINASVWDGAQRVMGPEAAAVTLGGILQRIGEIRSPSGYLKSLTNRAEKRGFSPGPMIMALLNAQTVRPDQSLVTS